MLFLILKPKWRNGRRWGLKIPWPQGREGSTPSFGIYKFSLSMLSNKYLRLLLVVTFLGLSILIACNCQQTLPVPSSSAITFAQPGNDIAGLDNFAKVTEGLYRGAQLDKDGFAALKKIGIKTVINMRSSHSDRDLRAGLGLQYFEILSDAGDLDDSQAAAFLKVALNPANQPVFVHCLPEPKTETI